MKLQLICESILLHELRVSHHEPLKRISNWTGARCLFYIEYEYWSGPKDMKWGETAPTTTGKEKPGFSTLR